MRVGRAITEALQADMAADLARNWTHYLVETERLFKRRCWRCAHCGILSLYARDLGTDTTTCPPPRNERGWIVTL